jgi:hypothetical protein
LHAGVVAGRDVDPSSDSGQALADLLAVAEREFPVAFAEFQSHE